MDKRKKTVDPGTLREMRKALFEAIDRGELSLSEAVRQMRALSGLTQPEFAKHRGVSVKVIREIEQEVGNPTVKTLNQIGEVFGLEVTFARKSRLR